jgi:hypothetical protein
MVEEGLAVCRNIFTAFIGQVGESFEAEQYDLFVKGVEFAQGGNVEDGAIAQFDVTFKRALGRNQLAQLMGNG